MYNYFVYGIPITSEIELPPLTPLPEHAFQHPGLRIRLAHEDEYLCADATPGLSILGANEQFPLWFKMIRLHWRTVGCFALVTQFGTGDLIVRPLPDIDPAILSNFILNNALGVYLLVHPQLFVFHASAVRLRDDFQLNAASSRGTGIALAGRSGAGKSTLAAALIQRGHHLLADDLTVLDADMIFGEPGIPDILPAFAQIKLDDESLRQIAVDPVDLPHVHSAEIKRAYRPDRGNIAATPLRVIYLLDDEDAPAPSVERLSMQESFTAFIGASYNAHLLDLLDIDVIKTLGAMKNFLQDCAQFAKTVQVRRLKRPRDLSRLNEVVDCVEADAKAL